MNNLKMALRKIKNWAEIEDEIGDVLDDALEEARSETAYYGGSNQTYYPGFWAYGDSVGNASTSDPGNRRNELAREHVMQVVQDELAGELAGDAGELGFYDEISDVVHLKLACVEGVCYRWRRDDDDEPCPYCCTCGDDDDPPPQCTCDCTC